MNTTMIMPTKQFIIGKLSESDEEFLRKGSPVEAGILEGHH
jgi:hypothetical protein